ERDFLDAILVFISPCANKLGLTHSVACAKHEDACYACCKTVKHLTRIRRKFGSPISAPSQEPHRVKRKHGFFAIRAGRTGQAELLYYRSALKESAEERRCFVRNADNLVRCLAIEFEIELGLGSTVVPGGKKFELAPPQVPLCERGASDGDAHARRLPGDPAFLCDRFGRGDDA